MEASCQDPYQVKYECSVFIAYNVSRERNTKISCRPPVKEDKENAKEGPRWKLYSTTVPAKLAFKLYFPRSTFETTWNIYIYIFFFSLSLLRYVAQVAWQTDDCNKRYDQRKKIPKIIISFVETKSKENSRHKSQSRTFWQTYSFRNVAQVVQRPWQWLQ